MKIRLGDFNSFKAIATSIYNSVDHKLNFLIAFIICLALSVFYFYAHIRILKYFLVNIPILFFLFLVLKNKIYKLRINLYLASVIFISLVIIINIIYSKSVISDFAEFDFKFIATLKAIIYYLGLSLISIIVYLSLPYYVGKTILSRLHVKLQTSGQAVMAYMLGLINFSILLIIVGLFGYLNINFVIILYLIGIYTFVLNIKNVSLSIKKVNINLKTSAFKWYLYIILTLFIAVLFATTLRSYAWGSDALRQYFVLPKYISQTGYLPSYDNIQIYPYIAELIFTPAYIIGGIPVLIFVTYFISNLFLLVLYFIVRDFSKYKFKLWMILPCALTSVFFAFYASEYKTDIAVLLFAAITTYAFLNFKYKNNFINFALFLLFAGFTAFSKYTALPYIAVLVFVSVLILLKSLKFSKDFIKYNLAGLFIFLIFPIIYLILYQLALPGIGSMGLNLYKGKLQPTYITINNCLANNRSIETTWRYDTANSRFVAIKTPIYILMAGTDVNILTIFDLSDLGLLIAIPIILCVLLIILARFKITEFKEIFLASLIAFLFGIYGYPYEIWYWNYSIIILALIININIYAFAKTKNYKFVTSYSMFIYILSLSYMFSYALNYVRPFYFPLTLNEDLISESTRYYQNRPNHTDAYNIGKYLNNNIKTGEKVLISSSASYSNIYMHFDKFYDRYIFNDQINNFTDENAFKKTIKSKNIRYLILSRGSLEYGIDCLKSQQRDLSALYEKYGRLILAKPNYYLYEVDNTKL